MTPALMEADMPGVMCFEVAPDLCGVSFADELPAAAAFERTGGVFLWLHGDSFFSNGRSFRRFCRFGQPRGQEIQRRAVRRAGYRFRPRGRRFTLISTWGLWPCGKTEVCFPRRGKRGLPDASGANRVFYTSGGGCLRAFAPFRGRCNPDRRPKRTAATGSVLLRQNAGRGP
jgi:hypothetical protein